MLEKKWSAVTQPLTANGTTLGVVPVSDATGFFAKQKITLKGNAQPIGYYEVKRVYPGQIWVGTVGSHMTAYADVSAYTIADSAFIFAAEQLIPKIAPEDIFNAIYARDPAVAIRSLGVDEYGNPYTTGNPLPVEATVTIPPGTIPTTWYDIALSYDSNNNLIQVLYYSAPAIVERTLTLSYDSNNNLINVLPS